ncbi:MAG: CYTH domain-containing protein [Deltaproteobacteria bacterium]|nr:CYTH domain-containing protein [Deltaproteobacteria bacterium]
MPVPEPEETRRLFSALLGVHKVVRKEREIALVGNVRIHLDRVEGLGTFLELEAVFDASPEAEAEERKKVDRLMEQLGIRPEDLIDTSYEAMVETTE